MTTADVAVRMLAAVQFMELCQSEWTANQSVCATMATLADPEAVRRRLKVISGRVPRNAYDAAEIAEYFFGTEGIFFSNLMVRRA
jgi:hypothetical protein